jgi:hypothetical protein
MQISEFKGIQQYHDGRPVSDYCNMIPLGNSVIDRHGEIPITTMPSNRSAIETFVDSLGNIYVAYRDEVVKYVIEDGSFVSSHTILHSGLGYRPAPEMDRFVTFAESSTKPSQVYLCDGMRVWYWNTKDAQVTLDQVDAENRYRYQSFIPFRLPLFDEVPKNWTGPHNDETAEGTRYIGWCDANADVFAGMKELHINSITWFDNRLVLIQKEKNTVWLSSVDPSRWLSPSYSDGHHLYPLWPWQPQDSTGTGSKKGINTFVPNYYASTASSANIQDAIAFAGQLYFLNDTSIEVWSATGNDQNPIQHNSQNTLYFGGRSPVIVDDTLYLLCKGAIHNDFVAAIGQNGQITHISNDEIDKMLMPRAFRIRPLAVRDQSMVVVYTDNHYTNGYAITKAGAWWRYWNDDNEAIAWSVVNQHGHQVGVSKYGSLIVATETNRTYANGKPIPRQIRGGWSQYTGRKILREVEIVCDTGIYLDTDMDKIPGNIFLRVSFDRGNNFGSYLYRKLGSSSKNDKVLLWRNCGSGNSLLMEFGTSDNIRFQIYGLRFELS